MIIVIAQSGHQHRQQQQSSEPDGYRCSSVVAQFNLAAHFGSAAPIFAPLRMFYHLSVALPSEGRTHAHQMTRKSIRNDLQLMRLVGYARSAHTIGSINGGARLQSKHTGNAASIQWQAFDAGAATRTRPSEALNLVAQIGRPFGSQFEHCTGMVGNMRANGRLVWTRAEFSELSGDINNCLRADDTLARPAAREGLPPAVELWASGRRRLCRARLAKLEPGARSKTGPALWCR